jgi:hypothetical protein
LRRREKDSLAGQDMAGEPASAGPVGDFQAVVGDDVVTMVRKESDEAPESSLA